MVTLKQSTVDTTKYFNLNGLEYRKSLWDVYYDTELAFADGVFDTDEIRVGLRSSSDKSLIIQQPRKINFWRNGTLTPYSDLSVLLDDIANVIGFSANNSGINLTQQATSRSFFTDGVNVGDLAYAEQSEGIQWASAVGLGNYYPKGLYVWDGLEWVSDRNAIADQLQDLINNLANKANDNEVLKRRTFEAVNKNIEGYPYSFVEVNGVVQTKTFDLGGGLSRVITYNRTGDTVTSMVLSGGDLSGFTQLTKTFNYTGEILNNVTYS